MTAFFTRELDCAATYWRIYRLDGFALGFCSHDRALTFAGITHRAAPGLTPSAIRRTNALDSDDAEVSGVLSHASIAEEDLLAGVYDNARIEIGAVNWETLESETVYSGQIGRIQGNSSTFTAQLLSAKAALEVDFVPRTSPTCRAQFCGAGCGLSEAKYTSRIAILGLDLERNSVKVNLSNPDDYIDGRLRFLEGLQTGIYFGVLQASTTSLVLDRPLAAGANPPRYAQLLEGCDHRIDTCANRFANAANFRGEPFLPGNDLLARYPTSE